jgi:hypothetical protein
MRIFFLGTLLFSFLQASAQDSSADSLLRELTSEVSVQSDFFSEKMMWTQRALWGENGLYRRVGLAPQEISIETREKELKIRRTMYRIHQIVGIATAVGMAAQGYVGYRIYRPKTYTSQLYQFHKGLATGVNIAYGTTALMSFMAPPPLINRNRVDNMRVHKWLSYVHLTGMITTNVLGNRIARDFKFNKPLHRAAALTTFAAYAGAIAIIKFEF